MFALFMKHYVEPFTCYHLDKDRHPLGKTNPTLILSKKTNKQKHKLLTCDPITVSSTWELTSVSMRYSQGMELIPPCLGLCTVPRFIIIILSSVSCIDGLVFLSGICVWLSSVARSCATKDINNKDNVCRPNIPAGIKGPPPPKTISPITWFGTISTRQALSYFWY